MSAETVETTDEQLTVPGADTATAPPAEGDPAPRRRRTRTRKTTETKDKPPRAARPPRKPSTATQVKASVEQVHQLAGMGAELAGKPQTAALLGDNAQQAAEVWAQLAARYPVIERVLVGGGDAALFGALLGVYVPIIMTAVTEPRDPNALLGGLGMFGAFSAMGGQVPPDMQQPYAG